MSVDYVKANDTIVDDTKELILGQFQDAPQILKFIEIIAEEVGDYEQAAEKLFTGFLIGDAVGSTLDLIGEFLNLPREGEDDETYRTTLLFTALGAGSNITRDSLYELLMAIDGNIGLYFYTGSFHDLYIYMQDGCANIRNAIDLIEKYLPIGTQTSIIVESGNSFGFDTFDAAGGFDRVWQKAGEGVVLQRYDNGEYEQPDSILPVGTSYDADNGFTYSTYQDEDMVENRKAAIWQPLSVSSGDSNTISGITKEQENYSNTFTGYTSVATLIDDIWHDLVKVNAVFYPDEIFYDSEKLLFGYTFSDLAFTHTRSTVATYTGFDGIVTTAAIDEPAPFIVYENGSWVQHGWVDERASTNQLLYSEDFSNAVWTPDGATVTADTSTAPDGTTTADTLTGDAISSTADEITQSVSVTSPESITLSVYAKAGTAEWIALFVEDASTNRTGAYFDLVNGVPGVTIFDDSSVLSLKRSYIETLADGWFRCFIEIDGVDAVSSILAGFKAALSDGQDAVGSDEYSIHLWGAQLEEKNHGSSYIATTSSPVTRAADQYVYDLSACKPSDNLDRLYLEMSGDQSDALDYWAEASVIADTKGFNEVPAYGITSTVGTYTNPSAFYPGYGDIGLIPAEGTSEGGTFSSRISLTSEDILGFQDNAKFAENRLTEYELDSKFSEVAWIEDGAAPMQVIEEFRRFSPPVQPASGTDRGFRFQSPEGITAFANLYDAATEIESGVYQFSANDTWGHLIPPNRRYYLEFNLGNFPTSDLTYMSGKLRFGNVVDLDDLGYTLAVFEIQVETFLGLGTTTPAFNVTTTSTQRQADPLTAYSVSSTIDVADGETVGSNLNDTTIGITVDPVNRNCQVFINGEPHNGTDGFVRVDNISGTPEGNYPDIGELITWLPSLDTRVLLFMDGSTSSGTEIPTIEDYGDLALNYNASQFKYATSANLPDGLVDMFGRPIVNV